MCRFIWKVWAVYHSRESLIFKVIQNVVWRKAPTNVFVAPSVKCTLHLRRWRRMQGETKKSFHMQCVTIVFAWISSEEKKSSGTAHILHLWENLSDSVECHLVSFWVLVIRMTVWFMFALSLLIWWESSKDAHLIDWCKVLSLLLMLAMACFQVEMIFLFSLAMVHEYSLDVVSSVNPCLKHV